MAAVINYKYNLLRNTHLALTIPTSEGSLYRTVGADIVYYHYGCDGQNDNGWGCAYRTLQTMCAYVQEKCGKSSIPVPSIREIQKKLVDIGDKPSGFIGSRDWIGALEVSYVLDALYDVPCKILHIRTGKDLYNYVSEIEQYFAKYQGFIMMGGDVDAASKGIAGICKQSTANNSYFLVVDPHFSGIPKSAEELIELGYVRWQKTCEFSDSSFYNICMPLV